MKGYRALAASIGCGLLILTGSGVLAAQSAGPRETIEHFLTGIRSMTFPIQDRVRHETLVQQTNTFLDLESMAKKSLGSHWLEADSDQQKEFMELLWKLIEHIAYPGSSAFLGNYEITYPDTKQVEDGFEVRSVVKQKDEALDAEVFYHLRPESGRFMIDNVILDGVSLHEDLGYQFDKIISESSFSGLLDRMREKLKEARKKTEPAGE